MAGNSVADLEAGELLYLGNCRIFVYGKHQLRPAGLEVKQFLHIGPTLDYHVMPGDPEISSPGCNIFRNIRRAGKEDLDMGIKGPGDKAALFTGFCKMETAFLNQIENRCSNPSFVGDSEPYNIRKRLCVTGFFSRFFCWGHFTGQNVLSLPAMTFSVILVTFASWSSTMP